ncbi:MAG: GGDEF domain-containing protein [Candidatus Margulisbacteria bacterium]|nr:GGDEF domain-containing protein [Candidatus Margulisiibacteriota bacterium]
MSRMSIGRQWIASGSSRAIIGQLEIFIGKQMMKSKNVERKFLFALLQRALQLVSYNNLRFYFHDEIDKERTVPINRTQAPDDRVKEFAKGSADISITGGGLLLKIFASQYETFIVQADQQAGAALAGPTIKRVANYLQRKFSLEFQRVNEMQKTKADAARLEAILQLGGEIDRQLARTDRSETTSSIIGPTMRTISAIFPRLRSAHIALWDNNNRTLVNAASLGVQWARPIEGEAPPFSFAEIVLLQKKLNFIHAPKIRLDRGDYGRAWRGGDSIILPFYLDKDRTKPLGIVSISTEAARYLDRNQLTALEFLVAALRSKLTLDRFIAELAWASRHDGATALLNKKTGNEILESRFSSAKLAGTPMSMIMVDLDKFKSVNDTFGHVSGDMVLDRLSQLMRAHAAKYRNYDCEIVRDGGEEFYIILSGATAEEARHFAEELREKIEALPFEIAGGRRINKTASMGVASADNYASAQSMKHAADAALYHAKEAGRNKVMVAT